MSSHEPDGTAPDLADSIEDVESGLTEICLLPDGRLCLFGASAAILKLLDDLKLGDAGVATRLAAMQAGVRQATHETAQGSL